MQIKNKNEFRIELGEKISTYRKQFPIYFGGNILANIFLLFIMGCYLQYMRVTFLAFSGFSSDREDPLLGYGIYFFILAFLFFLVTIRGFIRNINIISKIRRGDFDLEIEAHEMDLAIEFIEDLPMPKEDVEKLKVSLSYEKIIDVLQIAHIIVLHKNQYDLDVNFDCEIEKEIESLAVKKIGIKGKVFYNKIKA